MASWGWGAPPAALRSSEVWYLGPMVIASSWFPSIIAAKEIDETAYHRKLQGLLNYCVLLALFIAIPVSFCSRWLIEFLYGPHYIDSANVLMIHIWSSVFVFLGVASSRWFVLENLQKYTFYRTLAGCVINILLNYLLIPTYGVIGSAFASVCAQFIASFLFNFVNRNTRQLFFMQMKAISLFGQRSGHAK